MVFNELKKLNLYKFLVIFYLVIADGLNNPNQIRKIYSKNVVVRYLYSLFGAYGVFGSDFGMNLGLKISYLISLFMMVLLDIIPNRYNTTEENKEYSFTPFLSNNKETYIVLGIFSLLYFTNLIPLEKILEFKFN